MKWRVCSALGTCIFLAACGQDTESDSQPPDSELGWGAICRPVAQSPWAQALDDSGERFLIGNYLEMDHSSNVEPLITTDGGKTFQPIVAQYFRPGEGIEEWRFFDGIVAEFSLGEDHIFIGVGGGNPEDSELFNRDWMAISDDAGLTWTHVLREEGAFEVEGFIGNRRWRSGDAVLISDGETYYGSEDGTTFREVGEPLGRLAGDESGLGKWRDEAVEIGVEYRRRDTDDRTQPYRMLWTDLETDTTEEFFVDFGGLPVVELTSVIHRGESSIRAIVGLSEANDTHDHYVLCDIAEGQTFSLEARPALRGLQDLSPGDLGVYARGSHPGSTYYLNPLHMKVLPSGRVFYSTTGLIQLADTQAGWIRHLDNPANELRILEAPFFTTETYISLLYTSEDLRRTGAVTYDLNTGAVITEGFEPYRPIGNPDQIKGATQSLDWSVLSVSENGGLEMRIKAATDSSTQARAFDGRTYISGRRLIQAVRVRESMEAPIDTYIRVSDAVTGRTPAASECIEDLTISGCAKLEAVEAVRLLTDRDGRLFALDSTRQRLLRHHAEVGPSEWEVVVDGLHRPKDFAIRYHQGRAFGLILDGDILAIDLDSPNTVTRRFE